MEISIKLLIEAMVLIIFIRIEAEHFHDKTRRFEIKSVKAVRISIDDSRFIAEVADLNGLQPFLGTILFIGVPLCLRRFRSFLVFHFLEFLF